MTDVAYRFCDDVQATADAFANLHTAPAPVKLFANYCMHAPEVYAKHGGLNSELHVMYVLCCVMLCYVILCLRVCVMVYYIM